MRQLWDSFEPDTSAGLCATDPIILLKAECIARSTTEKDFSTIVQINPRAKPELLQVVNTAGLASLSLGLGKGWQKHRRQNRYNRDDDQ